MSQRTPAPAVKIALIGLDRVGASLGLTLKDRPGLRLTGFDRDNGQARLAQKRGLVHEAKLNLLDAAAGADLVVLSGTPAEQPEWLQALGPDLRAEAVVACLGPLLAPPLAWAQKRLPAGRHLVAVHPSLNPALLHDGALGLEAARADLFQKGLWALAASPECAPPALKLVADLASLAGARPYYMDPAEHDGLAAGASAVPALAAFALLRAAHASPGWAELRKVADRDFATATFALTGVEAAALAANRDAVLYYLDALLAELQAVRARVQGNDWDALAHSLAEAAEQRAVWVAERAAADWDADDLNRPELPTFGDLLGRSLGGGLFKRDRK